MDLPHYMKISTAIPHGEIPHLLAIGETNMAQHACECADQGQPDLYPALTGTPGWGRAEVNDQFVGGPFFFTFKPPATGSTTFVLSGVPSGPSSAVGLWSTSTDSADHVGDPNLSQFMPPSADFSLILKGFRFHVAPILKGTDLDGANDLAALIGGLRLLQNENGAAPYTGRAFGCTATPAAVLGVTAQADSNNGVVPYTPIARRADIRNGYLAVVVPATPSGAQPLVTLELTGFALNNLQIKRSEKGYRTAAWVDNAIRRYPTGLVGPTIAKLLGFGKG